MIEQSPSISWKNKLKVPLILQSLVRNLGTTSTRNLEILCVLSYMGHTTGGSVP